MAVVEFRVVSTELGYLDHPIPALLPFIDAGRDRTPRHGGPRSERRADLRTGNLSTAARAVSAGRRFGFHWICAQVSGPGDEWMSATSRPEAGRPVTCTRCGHVTPFIEGWMVSAVMHHILAVHGGSMKLMGKR